MGISRFTVMMIQSNEIMYLDTEERSEAWISKYGRPHALLLSCALDKRPEMENVIAKLKSEAALSDTSEAKCNE